MDQIGEETLFFALSYVISRAYSTAKGNRLGEDVVDSIAFAILDDWRWNRWRVFQEQLAEVERPAVVIQLSDFRNEPPPSNEP